MISSNVGNLNSPFIMWAGNKEVILDTAQDNQSVTFKFQTLVNVVNLISPNALVSITESENWRHENGKREMENKKLVLLTERYSSIYNQL